eukprot:5132657-Amphidinium_carterae.1
MEADEVAANTQARTRKSCILAQHVKVLKTHSHSLPPQGHFVHLNTCSLAGSIRLDTQGTIEADCGAV